MRPTAFISAPYTGTTQEAVRANIKRADKCNLWLWDNGYYAFCPHMNTAHYDERTHQPERVFLEFCFRVIRSGLIDLVVFTHNWRDSEGCRKELALARTLAIPTLEWQPGWPELNKF